MDTVLKLSKDFGRLVTTENTYGWTVNGSTTISVNASTFVTGKGALNITKSGTGLTYADATRLLPKIDLSGKMISFDVFVKDSTVYNNLTASPLELFIADDDNYFFNTYISNANIKIGEFATILLNVDDLAVFSGSPDSTSIVKFALRIHADSSGLTWSEGDVIIDNVRVVSYDTQVINPQNLRFTQELQNTNSLEFSLPIDNENIAYLTEWEKVELYSVDNGLDILLWTGQIVDMRVTFQDVFFTCYDEKTYFEKKRLQEDKDWTGMTIDQVLETLIEDAWDRSNENMEWETNFDNDYTVIDDMDALTGWTPSADADITLNQTLQKQGSGCISLAKDSDSSSEASITKTIATTDMSDKYITVFCYIKSELLSNDSFTNIDVYAFDVDPTDYFKYTFPKSQLVADEWNKLQVHIDDMDVTGSPDATSIDAIRVDGNVDIATATWGADQLLFDEYITTSTQATINATIGDVQNKQGETYNTVLKTLVEKFGGEYKIEKNRIIYKETIGENKTSGANFIEFVSTVESPNANNIISIEVEYLGRDIATSLVVKSNASTVTRVGETSVYGYLEDFDYAQDGDLDKQANELIAKRQKRQRNIKIDVDATNYDVNDINIGDIVKIRVERGNPLLDMELNLKVIQKTVEFANFTFTFTIVLKVDNDQVRNAPNIFAQLSKRIEQLEIEA